MLQFQKLILWNKSHINCFLKISKKWTFKFWKFKPIFCSSKFLRESFVIFLSLYYSLFKICLTKKKKNWLRLYRNRFKSFHDKPSYWKKAFWPNFPFLTFLVYLNHFVCFPRHAHLEKLKSAKFWFFGLFKPQNKHENRGK